MWVILAIWNKEDVFCVVQKTNVFGTCTQSIVCGNAENHGLVIAQMGFYRHCHGAVGDAQRVFGQRVSRGGGYHQNIQQIFGAYWLCRYNAVYHLVLADFLHFFYYVCRVAEAGVV